VERRFTPGRPDWAWCSDITYIPTGEGWLYLATVIDIGSRRLIGYSMAEHMRASLVTAALEMAVGIRGGCCEGIIFHSDRGTQYTSTEMGQAVDAVGMVRVGGPDRGVLGQRRRRVMVRDPETRTRVPVPGSLPGLRPAGPSLPGSTTTTSGGCTPASATRPQPNGRTSTVKQDQTRPRKHGVRQTGGRPCWPLPPLRGGQRCCPFPHCAASGTKLFTPLCWELSLSGFA
jgi:hypothetical protein